MLLLGNFQISSGKDAFSSEFTGSLRSVLLCVCGTLLESQFPKQGEQMFSTYFQMNGQLLQLLCLSFLPIWGKISVGVLLISVFTACDS